MLPSWPWLPSLFAMDSVQQRRVLATLVGCSAAAATFAFTAALWMRTSPPWSVAQRLAVAEVRRASWDAQQRRKEIRCRKGRPELRVLLIRHGESCANQEKHMVGGRDVRTPLSERGEEQARVVGERLKREGWHLDRVFSSHAVRAKLTAVLACRALGFPTDRIEEEMRVVEFSQGSLERQPREDVYREDGPVMRGILREAMFYRPPGFSPDGDRGESQFDVERRFAEFVEEALLQPYTTVEGSRQCVAIFSHGIAIRSFLRGVLGADVKFTVHTQTDNTSITELLYDPRPDDLGGWSVVRMNDASHLRT